MAREERMRRQRRWTTALAGVVTAVVLVVGVVAAAERLDGPSAVVNAASPADDPQGEPSTTTTTTEPHPAQDPTPIAGPAPTTTTTVPAPGACPVDAIELRVTTERSAYRPGELVVLHAEGTNRSDHDCAPLESWGTQIRHDGSEYGYGTASMAGGTEPAVWRAGATNRTTLEWNQAVFDGEREQPAPSGTYTVTVTWGVRDGDSDRHVSYTGSTTFEIREP